MTADRKATTSPPLVGTALAVGAVLTCTVIQAAPSHEPQRKPAPLPQSLPGSQASKLSQPPGDFPAPVFRGTESTYAQPTRVDPRIGQNITVLMVETKDSSQTVAAWYERSMAAAGWRKVAVPTQPLPAVPGIEQIYALRPQTGVQKYEKESLKCEITIGGMPGRSGQAPDTTVRMSVSRSR